jgi:hypothetical protein
LPGDLLHCAVAGMDARNCGGGHALLPPCGECVLGTSFRFFRGGSSWEPPLSLCVSSVDPPTLRGDDAAGGSASDCRDGDKRLLPCASAPDKGLLLFAVPGLYASDCWDDDIGATLDLTFNGWADDLLGALGFSFNCGDDDIGGALGFPTCFPVTSGVGEDDEDEE